jgi:hypothetical protein
MWVVWSAAGRRPSAQFHQMVEVRDPDLAQIRLARWSITAPPNCDVNSYRRANEIIADQVVRSGSTSCPASALSSSAGGRIGCLEREQSNSPFSILVNEATKLPGRKLDLDQSKRRVGPRAGLDQPIDQRSLSGPFQHRKSSDHDIGVRKSHT